MKKTIISTALRLIPKTFQNKALCKALNYICAGHHLNELHQQTIKLNISDLKRSWFVTCDEHGFKATKTRKVNIEVKTKFNTAVKLQNKRVILEAVKQGDIEFKGDITLIDVITDLLYQLDERRLVYLSKHLFSFLKVKKSAQPPRLDINNVQLSDLNSSFDVDFIRDEAVRLENTDLEKALALMSLAHQVRPNGPFIARKLESYKKKLESE